MYYLLPLPATMMIANGADIRMAKEIFRHIDIITSLCPC
jgi:site-specific recombinase XerD